MKIRTIFERRELERLQSSVVVEMWKKVMTTGIGKRKFAESFTEEEQDKIREYYKIFYRWHYDHQRGGVPEEHDMSVETYNLMKRACNFFGTY